ncbi:hypothetical protein K458DRAFT_449298 [Lentithecium fluviatile CBS 122367]|uniref:PH domain-containing protein n=1 Tax=Lentithecium fluviatile CBS 122367 TaxID=1168545 RepID=A0A6G1J5Q7_9PLEO|nr:hypothetical protein K458DRAFT_449298 [Lentithecium fluviatile CBS 122367]
MVENETAWSSTQRIPLGWVRDTRRSDRLARPTAATMLSVITCHTDLFLCASTLKDVHRPLLEADTFSVGPSTYLVNGRHDSWVGTGGQPKEGVSRPSSDARTYANHSSQDSGGHDWTEEGDYRPVSDTSSLASKIVPSRHLSPFEANPHVESCEEEKTETSSHEATPQQRIDWSPRPPQAPGPQGTPRRPYLQYSGILRYRAPGLKNEIMFRQMQFWLGEASDFGRLYFVRLADQGRTHQGELTLEYANDLTKVDHNAFCFIIESSPLPFVNGKHTFQAPTEHERNGWFTTLERVVQYYASKKRQLAQEEMEMVTRAIRETIKSDTSPSPSL